MSTLPVWPLEMGPLGDYADLDPVLLASLRTPADEAALVAAVEVQLTARATTNTAVLEFPAHRRCAHTDRVELRAA